MACGVRATWYLIVMMYLFWVNMDQVYLFWLWSLIPIAGSFPFWFAQTPFDVWHVHQIFSIPCALRLSSHDEADVPISHHTFRLEKWCPVCELRLFLPGSTRGSDSTHYRKLWASTKDGSGWALSKCRRESGPIYVGNDNDLLLAYKQRARLNMPCIHPLFGFRSCFWGESSNKRD